MKLLVVLLCTVLLVDSCAGWWGKKKDKKKGMMKIGGKWYKYKIKEVKRDEPQLEITGPEVESQREVDWDEYDDQRN